MLIKSSERIKNENSLDCTVYEYPFEDEDINMAAVELTGRYPSSGYVFNESVKEMIFVVSGTGKIIIEESEYALHKGDMILILPKQKYFLEGDLELVIPCSPEQHKHFEEL